ncbi:hypothetical protein [Azospirillum argentinense]
MQRRRTTIAEMSHRRGVTVTVPGGRRPPEDELPPDPAWRPNQGCATHPCRRQVAEGVTAETTLNASRMCARNEQNRHNSVPFRNK